MTLTDPSGAGGEGREVQPNYVWRTLGIWSLVAVALLLWWMYFYSGWLEPLGEWQFARFGRYFPTLTVAVVAGLAILPLAGLIKGRHAQQRRRQARRLDPDAKASLRAGIVTVTARRTELVFAGIALVAALFAVLALLTSLIDRPQAGPLRALAANEPAIRHSGPARLAGTFRLGPVARFEERFLAFERTTLVAPVLAGSGAKTALFTEVEARPGGTGFAAIPQGLVVPGGLPPELLALYRDLPIAIDERPALLVRSDAERVWRALVVAGEAAVVGVLATLFWLLTVRHRRALNRKIEGASGA